MTLSALHQLTARLLDWLPNRCLLCNERSESGQFCRACTNAMRYTGSGCPRCALPGRAEICGHCLRNPPTVDRMFAAALYRWPMPELIARFKVAGDQRVGEGLARLLAERFASGGVCAQMVVVPIPLHVDRLRSRGFNQAQQLARVIARSLGLRLDPLLLVRPLPAADQKGLDRRQRLVNLRNAFALTAASPASVLLVDDVVTTGATVESAAAVLRAGGATHITVACVARTPPPDSFTLC